MMEIVLNNRNFENKNFFVIYSEILDTNPVLNSASKFQVQPAYFEIFQGRLKDVGNDFFEIFPIRHFDIFDTLFRDKY